MENKSLQFKQWESRTFGSGYGSGELPILKAVKIFFENLESGSTYDHQTLEEKLGDTVTWLLINAFNKADMIDWGTSARYGWLTSIGEHVRDFVKGKSAEELYEIVMSDEDYEESICECDGKIEGHDGCGKNPMVHERYADKLKYSK